jgi:hypothetical protein
MECWLANLVDTQGFEYAEVVDTIRAQVSEFRTTLKSSEMRIPQGFPIKKIGISRVHAPNGVSTIRIEFACPPFADQEAILGQFLRHLEPNGAAARQAVEVIPVPAAEAQDAAGKKSVVDSYEQPAVHYLYASGNGSFQFVRDASSMVPKGGAKFIFYKDEFLTQREVDAVVAAYKEIYSYPNVNAFFRQEMEQTRRRSFSSGRAGTPGGANAAAASGDSKVSALCLYLTEL